MINPLKRLACKIMKNAYKCPLPLMPYVLTPEQQNINLGEKATQAWNKLEINQYVNCGDGPKFIGLLSASDPFNEDTWNIVKSYWRNDFFVRWTTDALVEANKAINFSGDQISGMLEAIWQRHVKVGLTQEEKALLSSIWNNTIFNTPKYLFKNPYTTTVDRGWLYGTFGLGNEALVLLAFLGVGYAILGEEKYKLEYDKVKKDLGYLFDCPDMAFWISKLYCVAWYDEHSQMSLYCTGFDATKDEVFKTAGMFLKERYKYQPEIQAYAYKYLKSSLPTIAIDFLHLYVLDDSPTWGLSTDEMTKYFSLRSFNFQTMAKSILTPMFRRSNMYMWEEKDTVITTGNKWATIDFLHLYSLIKD